VAASAPPPPSLPRVGRYLTGRASSSPPALFHPGRLDGLPGHLHGHPQLLWPERLPGYLGRRRQLQAPLEHTGVAPPRSRTNAIWVAVVPAFVTSIG